MSAISESEGSAADWDSNVTEDKYPEPKEVMLCLPLHKECTKAERQP